jgi:glucose-6-phosphate isomerase
VIVASKTFTTIETMTNAETARDWMARAVAEPGGAVRGAVERDRQDGRVRHRSVPRLRLRGLGRRALFALGADRAGADDRLGPEDFASSSRAATRWTAFPQAELRENLPVLLALVGIWHNQVCGHATRAVLPYDQRLARLPAYLQQLEMEATASAWRWTAATLTEPPAPSSGASRGRTGSTPSTS